MMLDIFLCLYWPQFWEMFVFVLHLHFIPFYILVLAIKMNFCLNFSFPISSTDILLVANAFCFVSWNVFIFAPLLKDNFTIYRILGWQLPSLRTLKTLVHYWGLLLLEKLAMNLLFLQEWSCEFRLIFFFFCLCSCALLLWCS